MTGGINLIMNKKFRLKEHLLFSYFSQIVNISLGFLQVFLISRYFGVEVYGQLMIIIASAGVFSVLLTARSSEAITRFFTREILNNNLENAKFIIIIGFIIDFITAILLVVFIYGVSNLIAIHLIKNQMLEFEVFIYSLVIFFTFLSGTMLGYLQSNNMFIQINIISIIEMTLKNVILLFAIFILKEESLKSIIIVLICASLFSYFYTIFIFSKNYIKQFKNIKYKVNFFILKEYWNFNLKTFISSSLKAGNNNMDTLLIAYFINANIVGIYQIIKKILSPSTFLVKPFSMLLYPKLIKYFESKDIKNLKILILKISMMLFLIIVVYIFCIYLGIEIIFNIMKIEFVAYYNYLFILLSFVTVLVSMQWWSRIFSNTVNPNYSLYSNLFATLFQLTITILSTYLFNLEGLLFSLITMNLFLFIYWVKKLRDLKEII